MENAPEYSISLICDERSLRERLEKDIAAGVRTEDVIDRAVSRLGLYGKLDTHKIDTSRRTLEEIAGEIGAL